MAVVTSDPSHPALGLFLKASRPFVCGELVHQEQPLLRTSGGGRVRGRVTLGIADVRGAADALRKADLFVPGDDSLIVKQLCKEALPDEDNDAMLVRKVLHFNSFAAGPSGRDKVVFPTLSRANHACKPNCIVDGDEGTLRAICDIATGTALTVSYLDDATLLKPRQRRQKELQDCWDFICGCDRCLAPQDDVRRFGSCKVAGCDGELLAETLTSVSRRETKLVCARCGAALASDETAVLLQAEKAAEAELHALRIGSLEEEEDEGQAMMRCYRRFTLQHPKHAAAIELAGFDFPDAVVAKRTLLDGWRSIFGDVPCQLAVDVGRELAGIMKERGEHKAAREALEAANTAACLLDGTELGAEALSARLPQRQPGPAQLQRRGEARPEATIAAELAIGPPAAPRPGPPPPPPATPPSPEGPPPSLQLDLASPKKNNYSSSPSSSSWQHRIAKAPSVYSGAFLLMVTAAGVGLLCLGVRLGLRQRAGRDRT